MGNKMSQQDLAQMAAQVAKVMMSGNETHVADVVRHEGGGIQLPEGMPYSGAIQVLQRKLEEDEQMITLHHAINATPYDGAYALYLAMEEMFGAAVQNANFFGDRHSIQVVVDHEGNTVSVPWGTFEVPGIEGTIESSYTEEGGRIIFEVEANIKGKFRTGFEELVRLTKQILATKSIYRAKALQVGFVNSSGGALEVPDITFMDVTHAACPIFNADVAEQFQNDVLSYILYAEEARKMRGSLKRGVLFAGPYGTGKTLSAAYIAKLAVQNGFTYIYCKAAEVPDAIEFANLYSPAVIFAEDIDKAAGLDRTEEVDELLNKLDGVDSKNSDLIVVFTTNHPEMITPAMLRPGRIDLILNVTPPDAAAALSIARMYAQEQMVEGDDFTEAGDALAGLIPATIAETVARARMRALTRTDGKSTFISNQDLVNAAKSVISERERITPATERHPAELLGVGIGQSIAPYVKLTLSQLLSPNGQSPVIE